VLLIAAFLWWREVYPTFWQALRVAAFNTVSAASTTGYASVDYDQWPVFAPVWLLFLSMWVTSSGSTGGGIKMVRALILVRQAVREFTRILHPRAQVSVKLGGRPVESDVVLAVLAFMLVYGASVVAATFVLAAHRARHRERLLRGHGLHQQPRPRHGQGRSGAELRGADRSPDLDLLLHHAARPARALHAARRLHARLLAQVTRRFSAAAA
jgi:hypothetical protein